MAGRKKKPQIVKPIDSPIVVHSYDRDDMEYIINNPYECSACGKRYEKQKGCFIESPSFIFGANNHFTTTCVQCGSAIFQYYIEATGNVSDALKRFCCRYDIYYDDKLYNDCQEAGLEGSNLLSYYLKEVTKNKLFDESYADAPHVFGMSFQGIGGDVAEDIAQRWGDVFTTDEYINLEKHYKMLKNQNPNCDSNQEIFIKDLCMIKIQQLAAIRSKNTDDFKKLTELYRTTFIQAGLKTVTEKDVGADAPLGVTLFTISQYTPEEYYKNKKLFADFDGVGSYFQRFVLRPLKNLMGGTREDDQEYNIHYDDSK